MGKTPCFICKKNLEWSDVEWTKALINSQSKMTIPEGMSEEDKICNKCFNGLTDPEKETQKAAQKEASDEYKQTMDAIALRVPQYKAKWNKNGVIQYKDDYVAILHTGDWVLRWNS
jgi:hypothetical protein